MIVKSDHKPLQAIFGKPLVSAPKRIQGMLLCLQMFDLTVKYKKGSEMYIADMLSTAARPETGPCRGSLNARQEEVCMVNMGEVNSVEFSRISEDGMKSIQAVTNGDDQLQILKQVILRGWPETQNEVPPRVTQVWNYHDELAVYNGILFEGSRVVVPRDLRSEMIKQIHSSPQGEQTCLRRARDALFWPGMTQQMRDELSKCGVCAEYAFSQPKEPLMTPELPSRPWSIVAQDLFSLGDENYLITVDAYSGFWEVNRLNNTHAKTVILKSKQHFARYCIPDEVHSDNGPQFEYEAYANFTGEWRFLHNSSSLYHSQANGLAESAVKTAKNLIRKTNKSSGDLWLNFLDYRNTPTEAMSSSSAQRLMSRRTKTTLPIAQQLLEPEVPPDVEKKMILKCRKAKKRLDKGAKELPELVIGKSVRVKPVDKKSKVWKRGDCVGKVSPRSYLVDIDGGIVRRN